MSDASSVPMFDPELAQQLVERAKAEGVKLTGPGGLLGDLTKRVLEAGLEGEMDGHVGYAKHTVEGRNGANSRNGTRTKTVITDVGPVDIEVPRDRDGTFEPIIVRKHQRRLGGVDDMVLSLSAKGLTTGEISAHLAEVYGASVSKDTISVITDRVLGEIADWQSRPLDAIYPVLFIDAIFVKLRYGQVTNRPSRLVSPMVNATFSSWGPAAAGNRPIMCAAPDPATVETGIGVPLSCQPKSRGCGRFFGGSCWGGNGRCLGALGDSFGGPLVPSWLATCGGHEIGRAHV